MKGLISKETVVRHQWGSETQKFGVSKELTRIAMSVYEQYKVEVSSVNPS